MKLRRHKRWLQSLCLILILLASFTPAAAQLPDVRVVVDGKELQLPRPPVIQDGTTLVPFRPILERLGAQVSWEAATQTVFAVKGPLVIQLTIGSDVARKGAGAVAMTRPAQIIGGYTMVPLRFISEALGAKVAWDEASRTVFIETVQKVAKQILSAARTGRLGEVVIVAMGTTAAELQAAVKPRALVVADPRGEPDTYILSIADAAYGRKYDLSFGSAFARAAGLATAFKWGAPLQGGAMDGKISSSMRHTLAVDAGGLVWAWGNNEVGQLGDGTTTPHTVPLQVPAVKDVVAVAAGEAHSLALTSQGTVWSWGISVYGQLGSSIDTKVIGPQPVAGLPPIRAIAAGGAFNAALDRTGRVWTWGSNRYGELGDSTRAARSRPAEVPGLRDVKAVVAGGDHVLALKEDGTVWGWGLNNVGQLANLPQETGKPTQIQLSRKALAVAAGYDHSLALLDNGTVWMWGSNHYAEQVPGAGYQLKQPVPVRIQAPPGVVALAGGWHHSVAITDEGEVWTWGENRVGELGDGREGTNLTPARLKEPRGVVAVTASWQHTLVRTIDGSVWAWGSNQFGQLGDGGGESRREPVRALVALGGVAEPLTLAGSIPAAGATGTRLSGLITLSWSAAVGKGLAFGEIALHDAERRPVTAVIRLVDNQLFVSPEKALAPNQAYTLTVPKGALQDAAGSKNEDVTALTFRTGTGDGDPAFRAVAAGQNHTLALDAKGRVWAWGSNEKGQLGNGETGASRAPVPATGLPEVTQIAAGWTNSIALTADGRVYTWGDELGVARPTPTEVAGLSDATAVAAGVDTFLALRSDGTVWAWGINPPAPVPGLSSITALAAGTEHYLALQSDGTVWAWGLNRDGQLGDGATNNSDQPVRVANVTGAVAVAAGGDWSGALTREGNVVIWGNSHRPPATAEWLRKVQKLAGGSAFLLAIRDDGALMAWGNNVYGELGLGFRGGYYRTPSRVQLPGSVTGFSGGAWHAVAVTADGRLWAWGRNENGLLGDRTAEDRWAPVPVLLDLAGEEP